MKIVCDACQAKYSISDDKVQGKVFKIRCKKCSNIIVVRGGAGAAEAAPAPTQEKETRVYDYGYEGGEQAPAGDDSVWHVVINQDQVGPMTAAEVQQKFAAGEIDGETFAWREGFGDWLPLAQVDAFAAFVASGSTTHAVGGNGGGGGGLSAMFGGGGASSDESGTMRSDPGDLFAAAGGAAGRTDDDDGGDLFGSKPSSNAAASAAANAKLRGERNENSVLFSLNNLAQLASDKPAPMPTASANSPAGAATGQSGGEGSGLIDIRSMANAYLGPASGGGASAKPMASSAIGSIDDLPVFGGGGFSDPVAIVPTSRPSGGNNKTMFILMGGVGILAVAAIIMVVVMMKGGDKKEPEKIASAAGSSEPEKMGTDSKAGTGTDTKEPEKTPDPTTKEPEKTADPTKEPVKAATDPVVPAVKADPKPKTTTDPKPKTTTDPRPKTTTDPKPKTTPDPKPPKVVETSSCDEVSCVMSGYAEACCVKYKKKVPGPDPTPKPKSDLPETLDASMVAKGIAPVKSRAMLCGDKSSAKGKVKVNVKVGSDGRITGVTVKESPDPALGTCAANATKSATFAKTQNGGSFNYVYSY